MARTISALVSITTLAAAAFLLASGCSSKDDGNTVDGPSGDGGNGNTGAVELQGGGSADSTGDGGSGDSTSDGGSGDSSSGGSGDSSSGGSANSSSGGSGGGGGSGGSANASSWNGDPCPGFPADEPNPDDPDCTGVAEGTEPIPIDLFIMMDRSISMSETLSGDDPVGNDVTRWDGVRQAVQAFAQSEDAANLGLGIQFFSASGVGNEAEDCDLGNYSNPEVPIGLVSDVGMDVVAAIDDKIPSGLTPTYPALRGALEYASWHASQPGARLTVVALVTDGLPTECDPQDVASIAQLAADARADHNVLTFVIGLAQGLWNLDQIAQAGGTGQAFIIQEGDVEAQFLDVMTNMTSTPLACEFDIPESPNPTEDIDYERVQMIYNPANGDREEIPKIDNPAQCENAVNGGWYYDSSVAPTSVRVCPCTCDRFGAGDVIISFGCRPRTYDIQ